MFIFSCSGIHIASSNYHANQDLGSRPCVNFDTLTYHVRAIPGPGPALSGLYLGLEIWARIYRALYQAKEFGIEIGGPGGPPRNSAGCYPDRYQGRDNVGP